jgi:hypothetical protein
MRTSKRFILLIVEGMTEKIALTKPLEGLFREKYAEDVKFYVVGGDLTSSQGIKTSNVTNALVSLVKRFLDENHYLSNHLLEVVFLTDTDGTFISESAVLEDRNVAKVTYEAERIICANKNAILVRNKQKSANLNKLSMLSALNIAQRKIPFYTFFFSCNLDHVLYNQINLALREKMRLAEEFERTYAENPFEFHIFFQNKIYSLGMDYQESWNLIKENLNSLQRNTNFHIFLSRIANSDQHNY